MRYFFLIISIVVFSLTCYSGNDKQPKDSLKTGVIKVVVQEVKQVSEYTYLHVKKDSLGVLIGDTLWIAVPKMEAAAGDTFYFKGGFYFYDLKSRELNRTFKKILFLEKVSKTPITEEKETEIPESHANWTKTDSNTYTKPANAKIEIKIEAVEGAITIGELYSKKAIYNGTTVKIAGKVTKFNTGIMNKNWIHLQDGTESDGKYDLTITINQEVTTGDIITVEGKISLDKDYGFGYNYEVIIEDARIVK
ncbi:MAG: hypothetical protein V1904_15765 [Bacteroidota bacterium]